MRPLAQFVGRIGCERLDDAAERVAAIECGMLDVEEAMEVVDHGHAALRTDVAALEVVVGREAIKRGKARRLINGSTSKELLAATPNLRAFQVCHGICYSKPPLPAPAVGRAFAKLPASLRELTLSDLRIDPGDLDEANELEVLRVNACFSTGKKGPEPFHAAKFRAAWPDLKIVVDYEDEDAAT